MQVGSFEALLANGDVFTFRRSCEDETVIVILNRGTTAQTISLPMIDQSSFVDLLNEGKQFKAYDGQLALEIPAQWGIILRETIA